MPYIELDVHKKTNSYCEKERHGGEGTTSNGELR